ncbi:MAG: hypothetical protein II791_05200, partial [Bacteroidales bacterium]|nr:hypothetical protein [Bacteroidales bacterium]
MKSQWHIIITCIFALLLSCEKPIQGYTIPDPNTKPNTQQNFGQNGENNQNNQNGQGENGENGNQENQGNNENQGGQENPGTNEDPQLPPVAGPVIVGYATYWDTTIPDPAYLTHINYSFAHIKSDFETLD